MIITISEQKMNVGIKNNHDIRMYSVKKTTAATLSNSDHLFIKSRHVIRIPERRAIHAIQTANIETPTNETMTPGVPSIIATISFAA